MEILIDTDVLVEYLRGNESVTKKLKEIFRKGQRICYSPITKAEIVAGLRKGEEEITSGLFCLMDCLKIDDSVGSKAGEYMKRFRASHSVEIADALIASSAHCNDLSLWTFNKKHYPMRDIEFHN